MKFTYVQLKQAIQDFTENDSTELTTATGSGIAPIDVIIGLAEERMYREIDFTSAQFTTTLTVSANTNTAAVPQDLIFVRWIRTSNGDWVYEKDESFIREYRRAPATTSGDDPAYYALSKTNKNYTSSNRHMNFLFAPTPSVDKTLEISYNIQPTGLSSTQTNTYLGDYCGDALLYACLLESGNFMKVDQGQMTRWQQLYERAAQTLATEEQVRMRNSTLLQGELNEMQRTTKNRY